MRKVNFPLVRAFLILALLLPGLGLAAPFQSVMAAQAGAHSMRPLGADETGGIFINEVMFAPSPGGYEWVELKNGGTAPARLAGYGLADEDGHWYRFPADGFRPGVGRND